MKSNSTRRAREPGREGRLTDPPQLYDIVKHPHSESHTAMAAASDITSFMVIPPSARARLMEVTLGLPERLRSDAVPCVILTL